MSFCPAEPTQVMKAVAALNLKITKLLKGHFLWWLMFAYVLGAIFPQLGLWIRCYSPPINGIFGLSGIVLKLLLAFLLFGAGYGIRLGRFSDPRPILPILAGGIICAVAAPVALIALIGALPVPPANREVFHCVLIGLGVVAAMPVAGSSVGWAMKAGGFLLLSVAFTLLSTLLSPVTVAFVLDFLASLIGNDSLAFDGSVAQEAVLFLLFWVIVPVLVGILFRAISTEKPAARVLGGIRSVNPLLLLILNYSNASLSLPTILLQRERGVLLLVLLLSALLCGVNFASAALLARIGRLDRESRVSLLLGVGMRNNGAGLVLIATAMPHREIVMMPVIVYNLIQHVAAGLIDRFYGSAKEGVTDQSSPIQG